MRYPLTKLFIDAQGIFLGKRGFGKRILGVWDHNTQLSTVGDAIAYQVMLNVLKIVNGAEKVDVCFIDDPTHPYAQKPGFKRSLFWKRNITASCQTNPEIGSIFSFDSNPQFSSFFHKMKHRYIPYPNPCMPIPYPNGWWMLIKFFEKNGYLPRLTCKKEILDWASAFMREHVFPAIPIVIQIRRNTRAPERNSPLDAWNDFFNKFAGVKKYKFVIIGEKTEIVPEFRQYDNVIFTKDFITTLEQDLSLIQVSYAGMFHFSGVAVYPWFTGIPSLTFGGDRKYTHFFQCYNEEGTFNFLGPLHKLFWGPPTSELIIGEFLRLLEEIPKLGCRPREHERTVCAGDVQQF